MSFSGIHLTTAAAVAAAADADSRRLSFSSFCHPFEFGYKCSIGFYSFVINSSSHSTNCSTTMYWFIVLSLSASFTLSLVNGVCWDTGCQLNSWAVVGCGQYNMDQRGTKPCNGGTIFTCCDKQSGGGTGGGNGGNNGGGSGGSSGDASSISSSQFSNAVTSNGYPAPSDAQDRSFKSGLPKGLITSKQEAAMALANFLQESDGLRAKREYACASTGCPGSYATSGCDAPGQRYFGRGYIQLSWCYNYKPCSQDLFRDDRLVRDPDMVARDEQVAWDTAFWFWKVNVHNKPGVQDGKFGATTRAINGGLECDGPHKDKARTRYQMYGKVRAAFGLQGPGDETGCYN